MNGYRSDAGNYRPVSLASVMSRLSEHCILSFSLFSEVKRNKKMGNREHNKMDQQAAAWTVQTGGMVTLSMKNWLSPM